MSSNIKYLMMVLVVLAALLSVTAEATAPKVGRKAAERYFAKEAEPEESDAQPSRRSSDDTEHVLMLAAGTYLNSETYGWKGADKRTDVGRASYGITYLFDEWHGMDANLRLDFNEYRLDDVRATKLSIMPLWTFPMARSHFPLYFGFGFGMGVFFQQVEQASNISFDYQLVAGARFTDLFNNFGFFLETAIKNHLHLLSGGQFNGSTLTVGGVFTF